MKLTFELFLINLLISFVFASQSSGQIRSYSLKDKFSLTKSLNGIDGQLLIHVSPKGNRAIVQLQSTSGQIVYAETLAYQTIRPLTKLQEIPMWFEYTVDRSVGFGSYNGIQTEFFRINNGKFEWLTATDNTGKTKRIHLLRSLKTQWKFLLTNPPQILEAGCRPEVSQDSVTFKIFYIRYFKEGQAWTKSQRFENGFLEFRDENYFPPESKFPN